MTAILHLVLRMLRWIIRTVRAIERATIARLSSRRALERARLADLTPGDCVENGCAFFWGGCLRCGKGIWDPSRLTLQQLVPHLRMQAVLKIRAMTMLLVDVGEQAPPLKKKRTQETEEKTLS